MATSNDREILNNIFNPLLPIPMGGLLFNDNLPEELKDETEEVITEDVEISKKLEIEGIAASEKEDFETALALFTQSINVSSTRASVYNNRAQTLRLMCRISEAKTDLNNAINLSGGKGRAACQAYCQRGLINLKENLTEAAKTDFEAATKLGSQFAKAQLVQMNPYAALCNKMIRGVFDKLQRGEPLDGDCNNEV